MAASTLHKGSMLKSQHWMSTNTSIERSTLFTQERMNTTFSGSPLGRVPPFYSQQREKLSENIEKEDSMPKKNSTTIFPIRTVSSLTSRWEEEHRMNQLQGNSAYKQVSRWPNNKTMEHGHHIKSSITSNISVDNYTSSPYRSSAKLRTPKARFLSVLDSALEKDTRYSEVFSNSMKSKKNIVSPNKENLSLGKIPNFAKCYSCEKRVKEDNFSEHLFFGSIICTKCDAHYRDCHSFQMWFTEYEMGKNSCDHNFSYFGCPLDFITSKLSEDQQDTIAISILVNLKGYVLKLRSLEISQPWKYAIEKCNKYLVRETVYCFDESEGDFDKCEGMSATTTQCNDSTNSGSVLLQSKDMQTNNGDNETFPIQQMITDTNNSRILQDKIVNPESFHFQKGTKEGVDHSMEANHSFKSSHISIDDPSITHCGKVIHSEESVSQADYAPNELTCHSSDSISGVTYARQSSPQPNCSWQMDDTSESSHLKYQTVSKKESKRSQKRKKKATMRPCKKNRQPGGMLLKYVSLPSNGHYYISKSPVEKCPDCYEILCPSQFTVNVNTFLLSVICEGCGLHIYIINEDITIFTDDFKKDTQKENNTVESMDESSESEGEENREIRNSAYAYLDSESTQETNEPYDYHWNVPFIY